MHVIIQSVPWRLDSLNAQLRELAAQTFKDFVIVLILDGHTEEEKAHIEVVPEVHRIVHNETAKGAWFRWEWIAKNIAVDDELFLIIDDDYRIARDYVAKCRAALELHESIAWLGMPAHASSGFFPNTVLERPARLAFWGAGNFGSRVRCIRGFLKSPMYKEHFCHMETADDAWVSWWYWVTGSEVWRPAGTSGCHDTHYGGDARSKSKTHRDKGQRDFGIIVHQLGFPGGKHIRPPGTLNIHAPRKRVKSV